jgi:hypothetical protein
MLRNSEQRPTQMVVIYYQLTLKNHNFLPGQVMIDILDSAVLSFSKQPCIQTFKIIFQSLHMLRSSDLTQFKVQTILYK